jgi:voltage-gated sodium channel
MFRERVAAFVTSKTVEHSIALVIILNAVILGLLIGNYSPSTINLLEMMDDFILGIFIVELTLKLYSFGVGFFKESWNSFDFLIISLSLLPALGNFTILRVFRAVKLLRIFRIFPELRRMIESTTRSIRSIFAITTLLSIVVYIFAVMSVMLFGNSEGVGEEYFGDLESSLFSLFQIMTLDSWAEGMVRELMEKEGSWVGFYFGAYILTTTFTFLNMFIAVFTNAIASVDIDDGDNVGFSKIVNEFKQEITSLKDEILLGMNHLEDDE